MKKDILLELLIVIAPNDAGEKVVNAFDGLASFPSIIRGRGTAPSEILSALGLGEPHKDMIFAFCEKDNVEKIYSKLQSTFQKSDGVIAMTIPVAAVGGNLTLQILLGKTRDLI